MLSYRDRQRITEEEKYRASIGKQNAATGSLVSRVAAYLNKPFTPMDLSTIFISVGGSFYTGYKDCRSDLDKAVERHSKLMTEIMNRTRFFKTARETEKSDYTFIEFDRRHMTDLLFELSSIENRFFYVGTERSMITSVDNGKNKSEMETFYLLFNLTPVIRTAASAEYKNVTQEAAAAIGFFTDIMVAQSHLKPREQCTLFSVGKRLLGISDYRVKSVNFDELADSKNEGAEIHRLEISPNGTKRVESWRKFN